MPAQKARNPTPAQSPPNAVSLVTMECSTCERSQRKFYCANCVQNNVHEYRVSGTRIDNERLQLVTRIQALIAHMEPRRLERAQRTSLVDRAKEIRRETERLRAQSKEVKERVLNLKQQLRTRRENLARASSLDSEPLTYTPLTTAQFRLDSLAERIAFTRHRMALVLMEAFELRQNSSGDASICGLAFPFPGDHRRYKSEHINGVITHTLQFLNILVFYLGVKLPFQVTWSGGHPLVGKPTIRAGAGNLDDGDWVKWTVKQPLYISANDTSRSAPVPSSFTTAISMLAFNVMYLLHTQSLTPPTTLPPRILHELVRLCTYEGLGKRSHSTRPHIPPPTQGFNLEFARVLEAAKEADGSKLAEERTKKDVGEGDWQLVDEDQ